MVVELSSPSSSPEPSGSRPSELDSLTGWADRERRLRRMSCLILGLTGVAVAAILAAMAYREWAESIEPTEVVVWAASLAGVAAFGLLSQRFFARRLALQAGRQTSLLEAISDLGEGLVIVEGGRYVAANAAYHGLTGYSADEAVAPRSRSARRRPGSAPCSSRHRPAWRWPA